MNDQETGTLTGIDCPGDQATDPPVRVWNPNPSIHEVHAVGEDGDHSDGRGILAERQTDLARDGRSPQFLLRVAQEIQQRGL